MKYQQAQYVELRPSTISFNSVNANVSKMASYTDDEINELRVDAETVVRENCRKRSVMMSERLRSIKSAMAAFGENAQVVRHIKEAKLPLEGSYDFDMHRFEGFVIECRACRECVKIHNRIDDTHTW